MFDFWLTMGTMVAKPTFATATNTTLTNPQVADQVFTRLPNAKITEDGVTFVPVKAAGTLSINFVTGFRENLHQTINGLFPDAQVTISLYVAGKLCQLFTCDNLALTDVLSKTQAAFQKASTNQNLVNPSARLVGLLGACLIDDGLTLKLGQAGGHQIAQEFFVKSIQEWNTLQEFIADPDFQSAQLALTMTGSWDGGCAQRFTFYDKFKMVHN